MFLLAHSFHRLTVLSGRYSRALAGGRITGRLPPLAVYALSETTILLNQRTIRNGAILETVLPGSSFVAQESNYFFFLNILKYFFTDRVFMDGARDKVFLTPNCQQYGLS